MCLRCRTCQLQTQNLKRRTLSIIIVYRNMICRCGETLYSFCVSSEYSRRIDTAIFGGKARKCTNSTFYRLTIMMDEPQDNIIEETRLPPSVPAQESERFVPDASSPRQRDAESSSSSDVASASEFSDHEEPTHRDSADDLQPVPMSTVPGEPVNSCLFADGDRIVMRSSTPDGKLACGRIVGMITGETDPTGLVAWRSDEDIDPMSFSGRQDILYPAEFGMCVHADRHLLQQNQRFSLFGCPDTKYLGHPFYTRITHSEFGNFTFGTKIQSASGGMFWCLGILDSQQYRSPLKLILYNISKCLLSELPMTKQCSKMVTLKPTQSDKDSYLEAISAFTDQVERTAELRLQTATMTTATKKRARSRPSDTKSSGSVPKSKKPVRTRSARTLPSASVPRRAVIDLSDDDNLQSLSMKTSKSGCGTKPQLVSSKPKPRPSSNHPESTVRVPDPEIQRSPNDRGNAYRFSEEVVAPRTQSMSHTG